MTSRFARKNRGDGHRGCGADGDGKTAPEPGTSGSRLIFSFSAQRPRTRRLGVGCSLQDRTLDEIDVSV